MPPRAPPPHPPQMCGGAANARAAAPARGCVPGCLAAERPQRRSLRSSRRERDRERGGGGEGGREGGRESTLSSGCSVRVHLLLSTRGSGSTTTTVPGRAGLDQAGPGRKLAPSAVPAAPAAAFRLLRRPPRRAAACGGGGGGGGGGTVRRTAWPCGRTGGKIRSAGDPAKGGQHAAGRAEIRVCSDRASEICSDCPARTLRHEQIAPRPVQAESSGS